MKDNILTPDDLHTNSNHYLKWIYCSDRISLLGGSGKRLPLLVLSGEAFRTRNWKFEVVFHYRDHDLNLPAPEGTLEWASRKDPFST